MIKYIKKLIKELRCKHNLTSTQGSSSMIYHYKCDKCNMHKVVNFNFGISAEQIELNDLKSRLNSLEKLIIK